MEIAYPFQIDDRNRIAEADWSEHIRQMIEQVLFTTPGERVNRPTFGSGLMQLIFAPNSQDLNSAVELMVQGALQEWLGELIQVESLVVETEETKLKVTVTYIIRRNQQREVAQFEQGGSL
ncbi:MAG: GPW/gp25 family protein [Hormoscilla sp. SP5CHS1]|nr:GPW/gp25 family protein [Hormoscilla sp. SP12CHS1]MBC6451865.1 GPW/gp25 family protein [Hormoscilla sp. SP5CHS1]